ncbi:MAG: hypothetical protein LBH75_08940, partial [Treponema sp.]|nr:hypothetical protein [Treponema sp.]
MRETPRQQPGAIARLERLNRPVQGSRTIRCKVLAPFCCKCCNRSVASVATVLLQVLQPSCCKCCNRPSSIFAWGGHYASSTVRKEFVFCGGKVYAFTVLFDGSAFEVNGKAARKAGGML